MRGKHVVVVGAGGNIGSHLVPHLGRMPAIGRVTLVDPDVYTPENLTAQDITRAEMAKPKAAVQARRLRAIRPTLEVIAVARPVEDVPLGRLRADVMLACVDSRAARQHVNEIAWRLGVPWIDAGVAPASWCARVNAYAPGPDRPCLECAWDERDYAALEQTYPCASAGGRGPRAPATNAPSSLGALAASLQAIECQKVLAGRLERALISRQVLVDAAHHKHYVTSFRRNPHCRLGSHRPWRIAPLAVHPGAVTLARALEISGRPAGDQRGLAFGVARQRFATRLTCAGCGRQVPTLLLRRAIVPRRSRCARCRSEMLAAGFDLVERLDVASLPPRARSRSLAALGLLAGDVFWTERGSRRRYFEMVCDRR